MKHTILIVCLLLASGYIFAQAKKTIETKIEKVTVFLDGAQVDRSGKIAVTAGKYEITIPNISPNIEKQSIQVKADGNLIILGVTHQLNFLKEQQKQEEIKVLESQKEDLQAKIDEQKNILLVYVQEEEMLKKNQEIKGANTGLKATDLKEAADFQRQRLTEIYQKQTEVRKQLKKLEQDLAKLNRQLAELNQKKDISTSEIILTVSCKQPVQTNLSISYLEKNASWFPTYDVRVKNNVSPIDLLVKANVSQSSGEDWKDVKLFLSTGNPNENGTKPDLNPWYLRYYSPGSTRIQIRGVSTLSTETGSYSGKITNENGSPVAGATVMIKGSSTGTVTDANGQFTLKTGKTGLQTLVISFVGYTSAEYTAIPGTFATVAMSPVDQALSEVVVVGYARTTEDGSSSPPPAPIRQKKTENTVTTQTVYQPTTTVYEIEEPYTIMNNGKITTVDINTFEIDALFEYYTVPKLDENAYLTAKVINWQELNLLPGEANLFFENTFLGKSTLDIANAGDTLNLSLGKDKGVIVKRKLMKEYSSRKFMGSNKTESRQYEITIRNNKAEAISIIIEDQLPISTQKEIEVQNTRHEGARMDEDTKKITWTLQLDSKKETKLNFKYEVKYPKDKTVVLD